MMSSQPLFDQLDITKPTLVKVDLSSPNGEKQRRKNCVLLNEIKTWILVIPPISANIVSCNWVLRLSMMEMGCLHGERCA